MTFGKIAFLFLLCASPFLSEGQHTIPDRPDYKSVQYQFPYLKWGTFFVSNVYLDFTNTNAAAADGQGNAYFAGDTEVFSNLPTPGCFQPGYGGGDNDGFIQKFDNNGERIWGTYYGGYQLDQIYDIAVDKEGNLIVAGITGSAEGMATPGTHQTSINNQGDGFIAKFNPEGDRLWGTYLGGNGNDWIGGVGVDAGNHILVCGNTRSSGQFATPGAHQEFYGGGQFGDGFLAKFTPDGKIVFCTYYGGAGYDESFNVHADSLNYICMTGVTNSDTAIGTAGTQQPFYSGAYTDGFLVKFTPGGERLWGTYIGGDGGDDAVDVCTDDEKNIYVAGRSSSYVNIATPGAHKEEKEGDEGYLIKYDPSGVRIWGTYFGGEDDEGFQSIRCSRETGLLILGGITTSNEGVGMSGAHQPNWFYSYTQQGDPRFDGMIVAFDTAGVQQWGTYLGGNMTDFVYEVDLDSLNNLVYCGYTSSQSSPYLTTPGCFQSSFTNQHASFFGMFAMDTLVGVPQHENMFNLWNANPNPFQDYIKLSGPYINHPVIFEIWNLQGYMVVRGNLNKEEKLLRLGNLSKGIYILKVIEGDHTSTIKIVKK